MNIDIINILRIHACILKSRAHSQLCTKAFGMSGSEMISVGTHAATGYFAINLGTAGKCVLQFLNHENGRTLTHHKSVT